MDIYNRSYLREIKYADWVKADSDFDYQPYLQFGRLHLYGDERKEWLEKLPIESQGIKTKQGWAKALMSENAYGLHSSLYEYGIETFWEWAYDGDDKRPDWVEMRNVGFFGNKFVFFIYTISTTSTDWDEKTETYRGKRGKNYGVRFCMLKIPPAEVKRRLKNYQDVEGEKGIDLNDFIVDGSMGWNYLMGEKLSVVKREIKDRLCRLMWRNAGLFPWRHGFINYPLLD